MEKEKNVYLTKLLGHDQLKFNTNNGSLTIWDMPIVLLPMNSYILIEQVMYESFGKKAKDIIYYIIKNQAYAGAKILHKTFGFKNMKQVVERQLESGVMMGFGKVKLERYDEKNKIAHVTISSNPYAETVKKLVGITKSPVDNNARGGMAGIFSYAFGEDMIAIETQCSAMGKECCVIEIKSKEKWDLKKSLIKEQMPDDEKKYSSIIKKWLNAKSLIKQ